MFQKDYWRMKQEELEALANKYNIPAYSSDENPEDNPDTDIWFDRNRVIEKLTARDSAMWAGRAILISILALIVSLAALIIPLFLK